MAIDLNDLASALGKIILRFRVRRRTADQWISLNEVLLDAEIGLETDTDKFKFGNGVDPWSSLPYSGVGDPLGSENAGLGISIDKVFPGTSTDPDWVDVQLLMHFNGDTKDSSPNRFAVATVGAASITTSSPKWSSGAGNIGSSGGYWKVADDPAFNFGSADWTIEGWFYPIDVVVGSTTFVSNVAVGKFANPAGGTTAVLAIVGGGTIEIYLTDDTNTAHHLRFFAYQIVSTTDSTHVVDNPNPWTHNAWNHIAVVRNGTKIQVFQNGFDCPCDHDDPNYPTTPPGGYDIGAITLHGIASDFNVGGGTGAFSSFSSFGKIDDFRVTTGVARYTTDFTVPAAEFYSSDTPLIVQITNTGIRSIVAGTGISIDSTDPFNPIITSGGGSSGGNITPDTHPTLPTAWDDEFEYGSGVDTTGARRSGANAWNLHHVGTGATPPAPLVSQGYAGVTLSGSSTVTMFQSVPGSGDWGFVAKVKRAPKGGNAGWMMILINSATGAATMVQIYGTNPTIAIEHGSLDMSTFLYTGVSNPYSDNGNFLQADDWMWLRIRYTSATSTISYAWNDTGHDAVWYEPYSETVGSFLGAMTDIGMMIVSNGHGVIDYFRRTI